LHINGSFKNDDDKVSDLSPAVNGPSLLAIKDLFTKNVFVFCKTNDTSYDPRKCSRADNIRVTECKCCKSAVFATGFSRKLYEW